MKVRLSAIFLHNNSKAFSDSRIAATIVQELHGLPLAIEQAGALLKSVFSLSEFLDAYRAQYRLVMDRYPEGASYDKKRTIATVFDMLYESIKARNPDAAAILTFVGILGPWQIPMNLMKQFQLHVADYHNPADSDTVALKNVLSDPITLRLALDELNKACLVLLKRDSSGSCEGFSLHRAICEWCVEVAASGKKDWIIQAARGLAGGILRPTTR